MKTMHLKSILKGILIPFVLITMTGCNSSDVPECLKYDTAPLVAKSDLQLLGRTVPFSIQEMGNDPPIFTLGLMPYARVFSFNENVLNSALYDEMPDGRKIHDLYGSKFLILLKESERDNFPVRVYLLPETNEIWWVERLPE